jgi:superfamily II DNA/RNA helicase
MTDFNKMGLPQELVASLTRLEFTNPTPIQAEAIPVALEGRDIMGTAQTGTGKTGAFGIPLIAHLLSNPNNAALIMTPTRELATQVISMLHKMLPRNCPINTALLIGGDSMQKQLRSLQAKPSLIVGTPGRINDHLSRGSVNLSKVNFLVLDETDRMLDMGFGIQLETIIPRLAKQRQTLMFSATVPNNILRLAGEYLRDPVRIAVAADNAPVERIKQETINVSDTEKYNTLLSELNQREGSIIIFMKTKISADKMVSRLKGLEHEADVIHGGLRQAQRDRVISRFRNNKTRIMVATDVAARGLDIPHIQHVINYDMPQCPEDYVHRIGRTGRAGAEGAALNLITPQDFGKWHAIRMLIDPEYKKSAKSSRGGAGGGRSSSGRNRRPDDKQRFGNKSRDGFFRRDRDANEGGFSRKREVRSEHDLSFNPNAGYSNRNDKKLEVSERAFGDRPRADRDVHADKKSFKINSERTDSKPKIQHIDKPKSAKPKFNKNKSSAGGSAAIFKNKTDTKSGKASIGKTSAKTYAKPNKVRKAV